MAAVSDECLAALPPRHLWLVYASESARIEKSGLMDLLARGNLVILCLWTFQQRRFRQYSKSCLQHLST